MLSLQADDKILEGEMFALGMGLPSSNFPYRKQGVKFVSCAEEKVMDLAFLSMAEMNLQKMEVCGKRFWKNISGNGNKYI